MSEEIHWSVKAAYIYFILILAVNLSCTFWANIQSYNYKVEYQQRMEQSPTIESNLSVFPSDNPLQGIKPLVHVQKVANTSIFIFIIGVLVSLVSECLLILPEYFMSQVERIVEKDYSIDFDSCRRFQWLMVGCTFLLCIFDILGASGYWDFANAFIK